MKGLNLVLVSAGGNGLLVCRLDQPGPAAEQGSRLLLYQDQDLDQDRDQDQDLDSLSCSQRLSKAQLSGKNPSPKWPTSEETLQSSFFSFSFSEPGRTEPDDPGSGFSLGLGGPVRRPTHLSGKLHMMTSPTSGDDITNIC